MWCSVYPNYWQQSSKICILIQIWYLSNLLHQLSIIETFTWVVIVLQCYKYHIAVLIWSATKVLCGGGVGEECLLIIILTHSHQIPQYHRLTAVSSFCYLLDHKINQLTWWKTLSYCTVSSYQYPVKSPPVSKIEYFPSDVYDAENSWITK